MVAASHNSLTNTVEKEELAQTEHERITVTQRSLSFSLVQKFTLFMSGVVKKRDQKCIHPVIVT